MGTQKDRLNEADSVSHSIINIGSGLSIGNFSNQSGNSPIGKAIGKTWTFACFSSKARALQEPMTGPKQGGGHSEKTLMQAAKQARVN